MASDLPFRFVLLCPECKKRSHVFTATPVAPTVKCGDCLMDRIEVVAMKAYPDFDDPSIIPELN